jgi:peroxin-2
MFGIAKDSKSLPIGAQRTRGKFWSLPEDQCGVCAENASFNPNLSEPANMFTVLAISTAGLPPAEPLEPPSFPIFTPYVTSCGHIYCYHCIAERMIWAVDEAGNGQNWECIRCGADVKRAERFSVEVFEGDPNSECEFSSDLDMITDMSGSMGSYSESALSE